MLSAAAPLVAAGIAVHWLFRRTKKPRGPLDDGKNWQTAPVHSLESLKAAYRAGSNIGVRPGEFSRTECGYLHLMDVDIRDAAQADAAWDVVLRFYPEARSAPFVVSGSGGESRHIYFFTDKPFRSHKLARSAGFAEVWDAEKNRNVKKYDWEIELFGSPKQAVLPPSIHPDTGRPYAWGREIDWGMVTFGIGPIVPSATVESWGAAEGDLNVDDDDDLLSVVRSAPMGLTPAEIRKTLYDLSDDWVDDRDLWMQAGAALHHEHEGGQDGLLIWNEWSSRSEKYDEKDQARVWKSFKGARKPVRMATLIKAAGVCRLARDHGLDDLLGEGGGPSVALEQVSTTGDNFLDDLLGAVEAPGDFLADILGETKTIAPGASGALEPIDPEWRNNLQRTEEGEIKVTLPNVELLLKNDPRIRGVIAFNTFTQEMVVKGTPGVFRHAARHRSTAKQLDGDLWAGLDNVNGTLWIDSHDNAVRAVLETSARQGGYGIKVTDRDLRAAADLVARKHSFHPVRDYLSGLVWDGVRRADTLFIDYLNADDDEYHRSAARLTLLGAVTRAFEPGHKFDFVPILEGLQGKRKSTFIEVLACSWFAELEGDFHDRQAMVEKMQGSWILEIPELQGFSKAEVTTIKGFVSARKDKVRLAYAKRAQEFYRQCIFFGSTNNGEYLRDETGGRRFWPIQCHFDADGEIDTDRLKREIDQIWAEAVHVYREARRQQPFGTLPLYISDKAAQAKAAELQESRRIESTEDGLAGEIDAWLKRPRNADLGFDDLDGEEPVYRDQVCIRDVWVEMMGRDASTLDSRKSQEIGKALKMIPGWYSASRRMTERFGRQRVMRRAGAVFSD